MHYQSKVTKEQAIANRMKTKARIKGFAKNVLGGAKIAAGGIKKGIRKGAQFLAKPLVREFKIQDAASRASSISGPALNRSYSGPNPALKKLKRGMQGYSR